MKRMSIADGKLSGYRCAGMRLLIFKVNQLGDNVVYLPVVQHLHRALADADITVFTSPLAAPLYTTTCPGVEVHTFATTTFNGAWRRPWKLPSLIANVRALHPGACLLGDDQGNVAHLLARTSGAPVTVGPLRVNMPLGFLLHHRVPLDEEVLVAQQNWEICGALLQRLGRNPLPSDFPPPPDLAAFGREDHGSVVIHPGASRAYQRWSLDRFAALANRIGQSHPVIWIGQENDEAMVLVPAVRRVKPTSLTELIRLIAGAPLFVGNNSGPMHVASALGVPGVVVVGPSRFNWDPAWHRERFEMLRHPNLACLPCDKAGRPAKECFNRQHPMACMDYWSVEAVHQKVLMKLG